MAVSDRIVGISVSGSGRDGKSKGCLCYLCVAEKIFQLLIKLDLNCGPT